MIFEVLRRKPRRIQYNVCTWEDLRRKTLNIRYPHRVCITVLNTWWMLPLWVHGISTAHFKGLIGVSSIRLWRIFSLVFPCSCSHKLIHQFNPGFPTYISVFVCFFLKSEVWLRLDHVGSWYFRPSASMPSQKNRWCNKCLTKLKIQMLGVACTAAIKTKLETNRNQDWKPSCKMMR